VVLEDGTCAYFKGDFQVGQPRDMEVTVEWELEMGHGITASLLIGEDIVYEDLAPSGSVVEDDITILSSLWCSLILHFVLIAHSRAHSR
jgi:hypothetical protein